MPESDLGHAEIRAKLTATRRLQTLGQWQVTFGIDERSMLAMVTWNSEAHETSITCLLVGFSFVQNHPRHKKVAQLEKKDTPTPHTCQDICSTTHISSIRETMLNTNCIRKSTVRIGGG